MSNSSVKTTAQTGAKVYFVADERIERQVRVKGSWLSIVDVTVPAGCSSTPQTIATPQVLRIVEGRLAMWRMTGQRREDITASPGDIITISAHQTHGYANAGSKTAVFSATVESENGEAVSDTQSPLAIRRIASPANSQRTTIRAA